MHSRQMPLCCNKTSDPSLVFLLHQGLLSICDLESWRARTQTAVSALMGKLHAQLLHCLVSLEQSSSDRIEAEHAAAATAQQVR